MVVSTPCTLAPPPSLGELPRCLLTAGVGFPAFVLYGSGVTPQVLLCVLFLALSSIHGKSIHTVGCSCSGLLLWATPLCQQSTARPGTVLLTAA